MLNRMFFTRIRFRIWTTIDTPKEKKTNGDGFIINLPVNLQQTLNY